MNLDALLQVIFMTIKHMKLIEIILIITKFITSFLYWPLNFYYKTRTLEKVNMEEIGNIIQSTPLSFIVVSLGICIGMHTI